MESAIKELQNDAIFHISWKPFFLNEATPDEGYPLLDYLAKKYGPQAAAAAKDGTSHLTKAGLDAGINFTYTRRIVNTLKSHCLLDFASQAGDQNPVAEKLFHIYFEEAQNINTDDVLMAVAKETGLDAEAALQHVHDDGVKERVKREGQMARQNGVTGVPFFQIYKQGTSDNPLAFSGAQPIQTFLSVFRQLLKK